jgi:hypothetical protein
MRKALLESIRDAFDPPLYMYQKSPTGYWCDKLTLHEDAKSWIRKRYFLTAGTSCTCLGFIKHGKCKHLLMRGPADLWPVTGVSGETAVEEAKRLTKVIGENFPKSKPDWDWKVHPDQLPDIITVLTLTLKTTEVPAGFDQLTGIRKFPMNRTLGIRLKVEEPLEKS